MEICFSMGLSNILIHSNHASNGVCSIPLIFNIGSQDEIESLAALENIYYNNKDEVQKLLFNQLSIFKKNITIHSEFRIWYSYQAPEYCGLLYVIDQITSLGNATIKIVNCDFVEHKENITTHFQSTNEIPVELLNLLAEKQVCLSDSAKNEFVKEFKNQFNKDYPIRINKNNKITSISIDECNEIVFSCLDKKNDLIFTMSNILSSTDLDNNSILYALQSLINEGKIDIKDECIIYKKEKI